MKDKELDAVKLALRRIQRISQEPLDETDTPANPPVESRRSMPQAGNRLLRRAPLLLAAAVFIGILAGVGAAGITGWRPLGPAAERANGGAGRMAVVPPAPPAELATSASAASSLEAKAQSLLEAGRVREARENIAGVAAKSPELALMLARSYDPNYLRLIANADAPADVAEAERWYRTWRDIAREQGLVMNAERFDRIIKAMR